MTFGEALGSLIKNTPHPIQRGEAELLLSRTLKQKRMYLYTHWDKSLNKNQQKNFQTLLRLKNSGMPSAYILKTVEFYGREFQILPGVFIPRSDTETLVSAVLSHTKAEVDKENLKVIIDLGSGTGCIGLSLLPSFPFAHLLLVDKNKKALELSKINAEKMGLQDRVQFICQRVQKLKLPPQSVDLITANPPYIAFGDKRVAKEVLAFEPPEALFSKKQGLYDMESWFAVASNLLKPGGSYFFEIGAQQDISFLKHSSMIKRAEFKDRSDIIRVVQFQKCYG